jgi:hypothetical protein
VSQSTHTCDVEIDGVPPEARQGHIVPNITSHSLVAVASLCDAGCLVLFSAKHFYIFYKNKVVHTGDRDSTIKLWMVNFGKTHQPTAPLPDNIPREFFAGNVHHTTNKRESLRFLHACCGSPTISTWTKAIDNNQFTTWPGLTSAAVRNFLPTSIATIKGHMNRTRKNVRSTQPKDESSDFSPKREEKVKQIYVKKVELAKDPGTVYTDATGRFPHPASSGMN